MVSVWAGDGEWPALGGDDPGAVVRRNGLGSGVVLSGRGLEGRVLFTSSEEGRPDAAFIKLNDPTGDLEEIQRLVAAGYIVRTRADADLLNAQNGETEDRENAFASGAQWVSTDYPATEDPAPNSGYTVAFPDGAFARCNPVNAPDGCDDAAVDPAAP